VASAVWEWPGSKIVRVIDGDTIVAELTRDLGFNGRAVFLQRLRLNRIDAMKASSEQGKRATELVKLAAAQTAHITTVGPYKYRDEWMAEVVLADGSNLSDGLVTAGVAVYWDGRGPRPDAA
jgi:endonuclease YncB( thermonuclease family)